MEHHVTFMNALLYEHDSSRDYRGLVWTEVDESPSVEAWFKGQSRD